MCFGSSTNMGEKELALQKNIFGFSTKLNEHGILNNQQKRERPPLQNQKISLNSQKG